ncbi:hypothetical protein Hanom_Chr03g00245781 [Helianthus anomalus]
MSHIQNLKVYQHWSVSHRRNVQTPRLFPTADRMFSFISYIARSAGLHNVAYAS